MHDRLAEERSATRTGTSRHTDGTPYRDLNRNGVMDPYEDPRLPVEARVDDLVARLSLAEKAGLMVHSVVMVSVDGAVDGTPLHEGRPPTRDFVERRLVNHLNVHRIPDPRTMARWVNDVQRLAAQTPHGIPVTISTDPRHSFTENWGASFTADFLSAWPEPLGLGALADEGVVREFADIARREYAALGIRSALHPTLDVATEPRWARQYSTFGQDAATVARLGVAYVDGFEGGARLGPQSIACMAKHFPGGGPELGGEDPHFPYGKEQVYPGGMFELHLEPFRRIIERGIPAIMPSYGVPIGLTLDGEKVEEVGFGFNRQIITGLLRERLGFDGVVCTDWSLVTESRMRGRQLPARAWGVEHLSEIERVRAAIDAGCDQLGGEDDPQYLIDLVESGALTEARIDASVRRLLTVKFELGLFDDPFVDEDAAPRLVGTDEFRAAGHRAQARSTVVLPGGRASAALLPLRPGAAVHSAEVAPAALRAAGLRPVDDPAAADVVVVRTAAPFEPRDRYMLESSFHAGSLAFPADLGDRLHALAAHAPVVLAVHLDRPALLAPLLPDCAAVVAEFGASDAALLDVLTGRTPSAGILPFDVPRTAEAVAASLPDVPGDTPDALFRAGQPTLAPRRRRRTSTQGRASQELILDTALEVLERRGYSATSLRDIAAEVGMTQAGMLHHFGTKENLLVEVLRRRDVVNRRTLAAEPGDEPMSIRVARHNAHAPALVHLYASLQAAASDPGHPGHEFFRARDAEITDIIIRDIRVRQRDGRFDPDVDAERLARVILALSDGLQAQWGIDPDIDLAGTIEWLWQRFAAPAAGAPAQP